MDSHARMRELLAKGVDLCEIEDILDAEYPLESREQADCIVAAPERLPAA